MPEMKMMTISDLEQASGLPRTAIHHYIREGLLHPPHKTGQTMAYYDRDHLKKLEKIHKIKMEFLNSRKSSRVPLDFIKHRIEDEGTSTNAEDSSSAAPPRVEDNRNRETKKREIIEAAFRVYAKRGYYQTRIRDISKEAGISTPTFYYYFSDKRELFVEAIEHVINKLEKETTEALAKEEDVKRKPFIMFSKFYASYPKIGEILNQLRAGVIINDEWARQKLSGVYKKLCKTMVSEIETYMEMGFIRKMKPDLLAFFLLAIAETEINRASLDGEYSIEELALFGTDFQFNGFLTDKGREAFGIVVSDRD